MTWTVLIYDRYGNPQNVTQRAWYSAQKSRLKKAGIVRSAGNFITLVIPVREYLSDRPDLIAFSKVVAGEMDSGFYFDPAKVWFGGYIIGVKEEVPTDKALAGEIVITINLITFDDLQDRTSVRSWPASIPTTDGGPADPLTDALDPALRWHKPVEVTDPLVKGYPSGYSAWQYLFGRRSDGHPFDGVFTRYLGWCRVGTIDPVYSGGDSIFDRLTRPITGATPGQVEIQNVRSAAQLVLAALNNLLVSNHYYTARLVVVIRPVADGTEIVPEVSALDLGGGA